MCRFGCKPSTAPTLLMGTPLQKIQFEIESPEYDNLAVRLTIQWSSEWEHQFNLTPLFDLSQRDMSVFNYLQDINFPADTSDTFLFDVVLLLLDVLKSVFSTQGTRHAELEWKQISLLT